jgi:hypothetical protein
MILDFIEEKNGLKRMRVYLIILRTELSLKKKIYGYCRRWKN